MFYINPFRRCKSKIEKGELRFGSSKDGAMHGSWFWYKLGCASSSQVSNCMSTYNGDFGSVPFFRSLSEEQKDRVRRHFDKDKIEGGSNA